MKKYLLMIAVLFCATQVDAQTARETELVSTLAEKTAQLEALQAEVDGMQTELDAIPFNGWKWGGAGVGSMTISDLSNWVVGNAPQTTLISGNIGLFGDYEMDKLFWNNSLDLKAGKQTLGTIAAIPGGDADDPVWQTTLDELYFQSLAGYKFSDVLAGTAMFDFRSAWLDKNNRFDPGLWSLGVGLTYRPSSNFVVGWHPLTIQGVFARSGGQKIANGIDLDKSIKFDLGMKLFYDYNREIAKSLMFYSNLNAFAPYSDFSNYNVTWTNGLAYQLGKYITLNFEYGLRYYEPEQAGYLINGLYAPYDADGNETAFVDGPPASAMATYDEDGKLTGILNADGAQAFDEDFVKGWQSRYIFGVGISTTFSGNARK